MPEDLHVNSGKVKKHTKLVQTLQEQETSKTK